MIFWSCIFVENSEDALLKQALEMSMQVETPAPAPEVERRPTPPDFGTMTEEQQIAYAMHMSLAPSAGIVALTLRYLTAYVLCIMIIRSDK